MRASGEKQHSTAAEIHFAAFERRFHDAIILLHRSAVANLHIGMDQDAEERDLNEIEQAYLQSGGEFLVGLQDDVVVAMGGFKPVSIDSAELKRMRVAAHLQRRGIGSRLLAELEARAIRRGFQELCLETAKARPPTLTFYRKHGYTMLGDSNYGCVKTALFTKRLRAQDEIAVQACKRCHP